jgi:aminoglycoside N3'-acetyltransferase
MIGSEIHTSLQQIGKILPKNSSIVVHVGLKNLFHDNQNYKIQSSHLLDTIREELSPNEIFIPTFSYSFTDTKLFNARSTPAEVGRFSEEIRKKFIPQKMRMLDPIFSVIETEGKFNRYDEAITEAFGNSSVWRYLNNKEHFIININLVEPIIATQLHYLEYEHLVPYRYMKKFSGSIINWRDECFDIDYDYYVRDLKINPIWNRAKIADDARSSCSVIDIGPVKAFDWMNLRKFLSNKLNTNKYYLVE